MRPLTFLSALLAALGAPLLLPGPAAADDWRQFRHDPQRTGASADPVKLPLAEIWSRKSELVRDRSLKNGHYPTSTAVAAGGRLFYFSGERTRDPTLMVRTLVSLDARTGVLLWGQPLADVMLAPPLPEAIGPVVTQSGVVLAYGQRDLPPTATPGAGTFERAAEAKGEKWPLGCVLAFRGVDGQPVALQVLPETSMPSPDRKPEIPYLYLLQCQGVNDLLNYPDGSFMDFGLPTALGHGLLTGDELLGLSQTNLFFRWAPYEIAPGRFTQYFRISHPVPGLVDPAVMPELEFKGYPMALCGAGLVVGEDRTRKFLMVLDRTGEPRWHLDLPWTLGIPAVSDRLLYTGVGGPGATRALMAVDPATGAVSWTYPGPPTGPDPLDARGKERWAGGRTPAQRALMQGVGRLVEQRNKAFRGIKAPPPGSRTDPREREARKRAHDAGLDGPMVFTFGADSRGWAPLSALPAGHWSNPGLVVAGGRVYGRVGPMVVALEGATGKLAWQWPVGAAVVRSLIASRDHLFVSMADSLVALRLKDGTPDWVYPMPSGATPILAEGMLYLSTREGLAAFAPAERTFRMAVDSPRPEDYRRENPVEKSAPDETGSGHPACTRQPPPGPVEELPPARQEPMAEVSVLRLRWGRKPEEMLHQAEARRKAVGTVPMLLSLDWLDAARANPLGGVAQPLAQADAFAALCGRLAAAARPAHFDVAPEVNVYLARHPEQADAVAALVHAAKAVIRKASPATQVLVSLNAETLLGVYGRGTWQPFGGLTPRRQARNLELPTLANEVEAVGLTSYPQSGFGKAEEIPVDYLLSVKLALGEKPLLVTGIAVQQEPPRSVPAISQAGFLKRILQNCYWLNASVVAYPELFGETKANRLALIAGGLARPAMQAWADVLAWKRVKQLTVSPKPLPALVEGEVNLDGSPPPQPGESPGR